MEAITSFPESSLTTEQHSQADRGSYFFQPRYPMSTDENDVIDVEGTHTELARAKDLPRDVMLLKMDHESIMAAAAVRPRNNALILKELLAIIDAYPAAADDAIYCKPVGTVWAIKCGKCGNRFESSDRDTECPKCGSEKHEKDEARKVKKYAENLSIRAAETIRSIYGANSLRVAEEMLPDGKIRLTGIFVDYATATMTSDERIVSPWYKKRGGGMERIAEDRFLNLTVKAEKAKLRRDLILDAVPAVLKAAYRDACEKKIVATVTAGYIEDHIIPFLPSIGLDMQDAEYIVSKPRSMGWTNEDIATLRKVCSGLKNGEFTKAELFDELRAEREQEEAQRMPVNIPEGAKTVDLQKPKGEKTKRPGSKEKKPEETGAQDEPQSELPQQEEKPKAEEKPAGKKPSATNMFGGDEEKPAEDELDDEIVQAMRDRIGKATTLQDCAVAQSEVVKLKMSTTQRAILNSALQRRKDELQSK